MLRRIPIYVATFPVDVFGWLLVLVIHALWGQGLRWRDGVLSTELKPGSLPIRAGTWPVGWYLYDRKTLRPWGGTTFGHAMFHGGPYRAPLDQPINAHEAHEYHHVRQAEAAQIGAFLVAIAVLIVLLALEAWVTAAWFPIAIWSLGGSLANGIGGWSAAAIRGDVRGFYRGSAHEVGAYAVGAGYDPAKPETAP